MSADEQFGHDTAQSVGARLTALRQGQGMSVNDVAYRLKLTPTQIEAIEQDDFASLGPIYSRGFVRNYARLLQIDPQPLLDSMQAPPAGTSETLTIHDEHIALTSSLSRHWLKFVLLALVIVVALPLAVYQWLRTDHTSRAMLPTSPIAAPRVSIPAPKIAPTPDTPKVGQPHEMPQTEPAIPSTAPVVTPAEAPVQTEGNDHIQLSFAQDAWVQITDAAKRRLTSRIYRAGETAQLSGKAPFSAIVGNASDVTITYNGKPVTLTPRPGTNVARLTIE
ncbi:MAG: RodZ domain-containing protein [Sulfuriferula sp.]